MLYAMLAACAALIFVLALAVPHAAKAHRVAPNAAHDFGWLALGVVVW